MQPEDSQWDASQFKLQPDGTFRISIRGMAVMAGVDFSGLARSLRSAVDENPLPCARSLVAQGFYPVDVSTWGETGGIPESAAPYILEHYGITASSPSDQARAVLLAFSRVGINAYLKERFGLLNQSQVQDTRLTGDALLKKVNTAVDLLERLGGVDERAQMIFRDVVINDVCNSAGGSVPQLEAVKYMTLSDFLIELECPAHKATALATKMGKAVKDIYRKDNGREPLSQPQLVGGKKVKVALYEIYWLRKYESDMREDINNLTR